MKKILYLFIIAIVSSLNANPCMTDIYFGNGVLNDEDDAKASRDKLKLHMLFKANTRLDPSKHKLDYTFKHIYNTSLSESLDVIETYYQLYETGQISEGYFRGVADRLTPLSPVDDPADALQKRINAIIAFYNDDVSTMLQKYKNESLNKKHNVLLVAHSQGTLFWQ